jgi:ribonuclease-3
MQEGGSILQAPCGVPPASQEAIQTALNYRFVDVCLLDAALTHASFVNEQPQAGATYERLEFVGDAALGLLAARLLYTLRPHAAEGELSRTRAQMVQRQTLAKLADALQLGPHLRVGAGQSRAAGGLGARILADALEALIGAVFLDGGLDAAEHAFGGLLRQAADAAAEVQDHKTQLQELAHRLGLGVPSYAVQSVDGPSHARIYGCAVSLQGRTFGVGRGTSKRAAEQVCARQALDALTQSPGLGGNS